MFATKRCEFFLLVWLELTKKESFPIVSQRIDLSLFKYTIAITTSLSITIVAYLNKNFNR